MPSLLPFTIPSDFAATAPGRKNPGPNFWMQDENVEGPQPNSYLSLGSPTVATVSYRVITSDFSLGDKVDAPWLTAVLVPTATDEVGLTDNARWESLRDALELPVTGYLLLQDGRRVRFYDATLGSKLRGLGNSLFVHLVGSVASFRL